MARVSKDPGERLYKALWGSCIRFDPVVGDHRGCMLLRTRSLNFRETLYSFNFNSQEILGLVTSWLYSVKKKNHRI